MLKEFKQFALKGNIIDLAVGVIIGAAFNAIVSSLVADIFMPLIGILTGGLHFAGLSYSFDHAVITYGNFIQSIFIFLMTAFGLFLMVKGISKLRKKEDKPAEVEKPAVEVELLREIRDLLKGVSDKSGQ